MRFWEAEEWIVGINPPLIRIDPICDTGVAAAFSSLRIGGVSRPPFDTLNLGRSVGDEERNVLENRRRFAEAAGIDLNRLHLCRQVHGVGIDIAVEGGPTLHPDRDGLISKTPGIALGVLTADCVPILVVDPRTGAVGAIHAGWRGTLGGIALNGLRAMEEAFGTEPKDCLAVICPSIGRCCYEVSEELAAEFKRRFGGEAVEGRRVDLALANAFQLKEAGVREIWVCRSCTCCQGELFFSHRRDKGRTGRMMSVIISSPSAS